MEQLLAYMDDPLTKQAFASGVNRFLRMLSDTPWEQLDGVRFIDKKAARVVSLFFGRLVEDGRL